MTSFNETVGFIGFGDMGQFAAEKLFTDANIIAHDPNKTESEIKGVPMVSLEDAAAADTVVFSLPTTEFRETAFNAVPVFNAGEECSLLVDISSVKEAPQATLDVLGTSDELLVCHPLFGPESAAKTLAGHRVIVTEAMGHKANALLQRWRKLGLNVLHMTAEQHDKEMIGVQVVPFLLGRLANELGLEDSKTLQTPSRLAVRNLQRLDDIQSEALFRSIVAGNPNTPAVLEHMAQVISKLKDMVAESDIIDYLAMDKQTLHMMQQDTKSHK